MRKYSWSDSINKSQAARFLGCSLSDIDHLISIYKLHEWARGGLIRSEVFRLKQSIRLLAQRGRLDVQQWLHAKPRKLWFLEQDVQRLLDDYILEIPHGQEIIHYARAIRRSDKVARARKYAPRELITKADAARILRCSVRGVEYLISVGRLRSIRLGYRTVVLKQKKVLSLARRRKVGPGRKTGARKSLVLDLTNAVGMGPSKAS
jgi:hypothetical protein